MCNQVGNTPQLDAGYPSVGMPCSVVEFGTSRRPAPEAGSIREFWGQSSPVAKATSASASELRTRFKAVPGATAILEFGA